MARQIHERENVTVLTAARAFLMAKARGAEDISEMDALRMVLDKCRFNTSQMELDEAAQIYIEKLGEAVIHIANSPQVDQQG